jgi:hypothetical protein
MNEVNLLMKCSICGKKYGKQSIKIIQNKKDAMLIHVNCDFCCSSSLAVVNKGVHNNESLVTMGILTDLGYEEACNVLNRESISSDEILDLYESCNK